MGILAGQNIAQPRRCIEHRQHALDDLGRRDEVARQRDAARRRRHAEERAQRGRRRAAAVDPRVHVPQAPQAHAQIVAGRQHLAHERLAVREAQRQVLQHQRRGETMLPRAVAAGGGQSFPQRPRPDAPAEEFLHHSVRRGPLAELLLDDEAQPFSEHGTGSSALAALRAAAALAATAGGLAAALALAFAFALPLLLLLFPATLSEGVLERRQQLVGAGVGDLDQDGSGGLTFIAAAAHRSSTTLLRSVSKDEESSNPVKALLIALLTLIPAGRQIYVSGTSPHGDITAMVGEPATEVPASVMPCANCHGADGRGRTEGGVAAPDITHEALTTPYSVTAPSGRRHGPYDDSRLKRAITMGIDASGHRLLPIMPRYRLSIDDMNALLAYLKVVGQ